MSPKRPTPPHDLLALTAQMVDIASESRQEGPITAWFQAALEAIRGLSVTRVGDNLVGRPHRARAALPHHPGRPHRHRPSR